MFVPLKLLKVLAFDTSISLQRVPVQLGDLVFLRYLSITQWFQDLDIVVSNNPNLETLVVSGNGTPRVHLPSSIWKSPHLRHLELGNSYLVDPPSAEKNNLQTLSWVDDIEPNHIGGCCNNPIILDHFDCLEELVKLSISVSIGCNAALPEQCMYPSRLNRLTLSGTNISERDLNVIAMLPQLNVLKLENAFHGAIPECFGRISLLESIELEGCHSSLVASAKQLPQKIRFKDVKPFNSQDDIKTCQRKHIKICHKAIGVMVNQNLLADSRAREVFPICDCYSHAWTRAGCKIKGLDCGSIDKVVETPAMAFKEISATSGASSSASNGSSSSHTFKIQKRCLQRWPRNHVSSQLKQRPFALRSSCSAGDNRRSGGGLKLGLGGARGFVTVITGLLGKEETGRGDCRATASPNNWNFLAKSRAVFTASAKEAGLLRSTSIRKSSSSPAVNKSTCCSKRTEVARANNVWKSSTYSSICLPRCFKLANSPKGLLLRGGPKRNLQYSLNKSQDRGGGVAGGVAGCWARIKSASNCFNSLTDSQSFDYYVLFGTNIPRSIFFFLENPEIFVPPKLLRVLAFDTSISSLQRVPVQLGGLVFLRYLSITQWFEDLDDVMSNNSNLETLVVSGNGAPTIHLPSSIWKPPHLRHVEIGNSYTVDPPSVDKKSLQTLAWVVRPVHCRKKMYSKFPNIKNLKIFLKDDIEPSHIRGCCSNPIILDHFDCLEGLEKLSISVSIGCNAALPKQCMYPSRLKKLKLSGTNISERDLNVIAMLPQLEVLKLENAFHGTVWEVAKEGFRQLIFLLLEAKELKQWELNGNQFWVLRRLVLRSCNCLEQIPMHFAETFGLKSIELEGCKSSLVASAKQLQQKGRSKDVEVRS
nr:putative late blight resistance protein homolog R1A-4 isoform X1 [Ipomoea trifida]